MTPPTQWRYHRSKRLCLSVVGNAGPSQNCCSCCERCFRGINSFPCTGGFFGWWGRGGTKGVWGVLWFKYYAAPDWSTCRLSLLTDHVDLPTAAPATPVCCSLWGWQDVIKAVFSEKVVVLATYGDRSIRSPSVVVQLPSVIALKVGILLLFRPFFASFVPLVRCCCVLVQPL